MLDQLNDCVPVAWIVIVAIWTAFVAGVAGYRIGLKR